MCTYFTYTVWNVFIVGLMSHQAEGFENYPFSFLTILSYILPISVTSGMSQ
jgi:hypothetical protein